MGRTPVMPRPWPTEPAGSADATTRMAWYAAVARWAPSKHNTQPWRFVLRGDTLEVWADPIRLLTMTDPHRREVTISCGAAVETACVAARAHGHEPDVTPQPDGAGGQPGADVLPVVDRFLQQPRGVAAQVGQDQPGRRRAGA